MNKTIAVSSKYFVEYTYKNDRKEASVEFDSREKAVYEIMSTAKMQAEMIQALFPWERVESAVIKEIYYFEEVTLDEG
jgi:hypothetical protein